MNVPRRSAAHVLIENVLLDGLGGCDIQYVLKTGHWVNNQIGGFLCRDSAYYPFVDITPSVYPYIFYDIIRQCPYLLAGSATLANQPHLNVFMLDLNIVVPGSLIVTRGRHPQLPAHINNFSPMIEGSTLVDYTIKRGSSARPASHAGPLYRANALFPHSILTKWVYVFIITDIILFSPFVLSYADNLFTHDQDLNITLHDPDHIKLSPEQKQGGQAITQRGLYGRRKIIR